MAELQNRTRIFKVQHLIYTIFTIRMGSETMREGEEGEKRGENRWPWEHVQAGCAVILNMNPVLRRAFLLVCPPAV